MRGCFFFVLALVGVSLVMVLVRWRMTQLGERFAGSF